MKEALPSAASQPSVAALIPCYNYGRFLRRAVNSLQQQTIPLREILVVDDGSTDQYTKQVLKELVKEDAIRCIHLEQNQGLPTARNRGIESLDTDYILLLDSDDHYDPRFLEEALRQKMNDRVAGIGCYLQFHEVDKDGLERPLKKRWKPSGGRLAAFLFAPSSGSCLLLNKAAWREVGGYDEEIPLYEDWELWIRITAAGWHIKTMPYFFYNYYVHGANMSRDTTPEGLLRKYKALEYIYKKHASLYRRHFYAAYMHLIRQLAYNPKLLFRPPQMLFFAGRQNQGSIRILTELWAAAAYLIKRLFFIK